MKQDIHPTYYSDVTVTCACGTTYITGSSRSELSVELCRACHPFYTGKQNLVDTAGRVDKFAQRVAKQSTVSSERKGKKAKAATRVRKEKNAEA